MAVKHKTWGRRFMTGIRIWAVYDIRCDHCQVRAEPDIEYRTMDEAVEARDRVARHDGWLLRDDGFIPVLLCPECAAKPQCR